MTPREQIEEIDQLLFDAGCAALHCKNKVDQKYVDGLIMDARIKLEHLRQALP